MSGDIALIVCLQLPHFMASFIILPLLCNHITTQIKNKKKIKNNVYSHRANCFLWVAIWEMRLKNIQDETSENNLKETLATLFNFQLQF